MMRVNGQISLIIDLTPEAVMSSVATASVITLGFDLAPWSGLKVGRFKLGQSVAAPALKLA
jgi:hypothetical protein